jgi:bifunctional DNase/RNase
MGRTFIVVGDERRAVPIWIADLEADRIRLALAGQPAARPLTHDLMLNVVTELGWRVSEAQVSKVGEGFFFGTLVLTNGRERKEIDARASDAIALGLRAKAPIVVAEQVYEAAMSRDAAGQPLSLDEAVRQVQEAPADVADVAVQVLSWALAQGLPTLEITPRQPTSQVRAKGDNALATYGDLKSDLHRQLVRRLKELAGLKPNEVGQAQTGTFDYEHPTKGKLRLTLTVEPAPTTESVRVEIGPAAK